MPFLKKKASPLFVALKSCVLQSTEQGLLWIVVERLPQLLCPILDVIEDLIPNDMESVKDVADGRDASLRPDPCCSCPGD